MVSGFSLLTGLASKIQDCVPALRQGSKGTDPTPEELLPVFIICVAVMPRSLRHGTSGFVFHSRQLGKGEHALLKKMRGGGMGRTPNNSVAGFLTGITQNKLIYIS